MIFYILDKEEQIVTTLSDDVVVQDSAPLLSAKLHEKLNGVDKLVLETLADSKESGKLLEDYTIVFADKQGIKEFIISEVVESESDSMIKEVSAKYSAQELADDIIQSNLISADPKANLSAMLSGTRWEVGFVEAGIYNKKLTEETKHLNVLEGVFLLQSFYNCDVHFSYVAEKGKIVRRLVNLYAKLGADAGKRFEIGKDVTEIKRTVDTTNIKTAIIPIGRRTTDDSGKETYIDITDVVWSKAKGDPVDKPKGQNWLGDPVALSNWGRRNADGKLRHRFIFMELDLETPAELCSMAWVRLGTYTQPKVTYEAKVLDLYRLTGDDDFQHEHVFIGDTAAIIDNYFAVPIQSVERVIEIDRDLLLPENDSVVLGMSKGSYSTDLNRVDELSNVVSEANRNAIIAMVSANGKNRNYYGSITPPEAQLIKGDSWIRPHPQKPTETQWLIWNGTQWVIEMDTSVISDAQQAAEDAQNAANDAKQAGEEAKAVGEEAQAAAEDAQKVGNEAKATGEAAKQTAEDAKQVGQKAQAAAEDAQKAGNNAQLSANEAKAAGEVAKQLAEDAIPKNEPIRYINLTGETVKIGGGKLWLTAQTIIDNGIIKTAHIVDASITTAKIANLAVGEAQIGNASITTAKIKDLAVTNAQIGNAAINSAKIANLAVDEGKIGNLAVSTAKIADLAVSEAKITNLAVTNAKIGDLAVNTAKIANLSVSEAKIADLAVTNAKIGNAAITEAKIGNAAINTAHIQNASITAAKILEIDAGTIKTGTLQAIDIKGVRIAGSTFVTEDDSAVFNIEISGGSMNFFKKLPIGVDFMGALRAGYVLGQPVALDFFVKSGYELRLSTGDPAILGKSHAVFMIPKESTPTSLKYKLNGAGEFNGKITLPNSDVAANAVVANANKDLWVAAGSGKSIIFSNNGTAKMKVDGAGAYIWGTLGVSGAKNAIHVTRDGVRATPAYETAESYLGDIGTAETDITGSRKVVIDTLFSDTVNTEQYEYQVFLQSYSEGKVWVSERHADYFIVQSDMPGAQFVWEIKAKRRGYEKDRLVLHDFNYKEIEEIYKEEK